MYGSGVIEPYSTNTLTRIIGSVFHIWASIGDRAGRTVQRLNELYATNGQIGYVSTERVDGKVILPEGIENADDEYLETTFGKLSDKEKKWIQNALELLKQDYSLIAVIKTLKQALDDQSLAKEERIQIEAKCEKAIIQLLEDRDKMNLAVENYLSAYLLSFHKGFDLIDTGMQTHDTDLVIQGNVLIQEQMGYDTQFCNQSEFDKLMASDDDFKL